MAWRRLPAWTINGLTVTLGLAFTQYLIGAWAGPVAAQTAIAYAVCTSLADLVMATERVARRTLVALLCSATSAALFLALRPHGVVLLPGVVLIVFGAMMTLSWGPKASSVSFATILSLVFAMSLPESQALTWRFVFWGLAGSATYWLWAVVTSWLLQPTWRRLALVATVESMALFFDAVARRAVRPGDSGLQFELVRHESLLADRLQGARDLVFGQAQGARSDRETLLLLHLLELRELAMVASFELDGSSPVQVARTLDEMAGALRAIAAQIGRDGVPSQTRACGPSIVGLRDELAQLSVSGRPARGDAMHEVLRRQHELIVAIVAALSPGATTGLSCRRDDLRSYIAPDEWQLSSWRSDLCLTSPVFRHAARTALTVGVAYAISRALPFAPHPQWIVLTIAAVMQGNLAQTLARRNARVLGTLAGCVLVGFLTWSSSVIFFPVYFLIAAGVAHAFFGVRYSVTAGAAAVMAVLQAYLVAPAGGFGVLERFADTLVGALLGWGATYLLPNWERERLSAALRQARDALRAYAEEAVKGQASAVCPRFTRQKAYDAIRVLSEARSRSRVEPMGVQVPMNELGVWLSAAYALMSHLSTVRLTLALEERDARDPALANALVVVSRVLTQALLAGASTGRPLRVVEREDEAMLVTVPGLLPRLERAFDVASRVGFQSWRLNAALRSEASLSGD